MNSVEQASVTRMAQSRRYRGSAYKEPDLKAFLFTPRSQEILAAIQAELHGRSGGGALEPVIEPEPLEIALLAIVEGIKSGTAWHEHLAAVTGTKDRGMAKT